MYEREKDMTVGVLFGSGHVRWVGWERFHSLLHTRSLSLSLSMLLFLSLSMLLFLSLSMLLFLSLSMLLFLSLSYFQSPSF